jgi:hypothetical protein
MAVHSRTEVPVQWDFLPSREEVDRLARGGETAPALTMEEAFDRHVNQPEVHPADFAVVEGLLGKPVDGRWQVGGPGATHRFRG